MATHQFVLSAGHRNVNGGGADREIEWTYPQCVLIRDEIKRRGGKAWIIQEEDGDNDRSFSVGRGLQNVAALCVDLAKVVGGVDAYISVHYEGVGDASVRGFFGIFPDSPVGGVDIRANNPADYRLCQVLANHVTKTGMPKRTGWVVEPGVMSERQTGVGGQGFRLGEFVGTFGFRDTTARVIIEAGAYTNPTDRAMLWDDAWRRKYASALVDGLEEMYGTFKGGTAPLPDPAPEPTPQPKYESPSPIRELADSRPLVLLNNGATLVRVDAVVETIRNTPRLKYAGGSALVGPDLPKGERFLTDYLVILESGDMYWYTPWATRVRYEDTRIIEGEGR